MAKTSLRNLFFRFLSYILAFIIGTAALGFIIFGLLIKLNFIFPASFPASYLSTFISEVNQSESLGQVDIPSFYAYTFYDQEGKIIKSNMPEAEQKTSQKYQTQSSWESSLGWQKVIQFQPTKYGSLSVIYSITAEFVNPTLRRYLPKAEWLFFTFLFMIILSGFLFISSLFGKRVNRELAKLIEVTNEIGEMNLNHSQDTSSIKEINDVLSSIYAMETNLETALKKQWQAEQQTQETLQAIAHDIKTPMTIISGNLELLSETQLDPEQISYLTFANQHLARMSYYVEEVTRLATEAEPLSSAWAVVSIQELKEQVVNLSRSLIPEIVVIDLLTNSDLTQQVQLDEELFLRGLQNVLVNATEHATLPQKISLTFQPKQEALVITITDNGPGFSQSDLVHGKEKFYTNEKSRSQGKHYGMGLAIAEKSLLTHQGSLHLSNKIDNEMIVGAEVQLRLPLN